MTDPNPTDRDKVEKFADAFLASFRAGERPSMDELVDQFPDLADELGGLLKAMVILEQSTPLEEQTAPQTNGTPASEAAPRQMGDFLIVREIGRGGMGVVYEAVQQSLRRHVALKVLSSPSLLNPSHLERFRREARAAARLQHGHIVPVFGFGSHEGTHYYAMQFVAGQSLDLMIESLRQSPPVSGEQSLRANDSDPDTRAKALSDTGFSTGAGRREFYRNVARIGLQAAEALAYAHSEGVLHRDIKPSNMLLDAKGNIWITDFGLAKTEGADELTQTGDFVGTLRYSAPERLEGWSDRRSDLYGLGVTLYELLTLRPLFVNRNRAELVRFIAEGTPRAPRQIDASIPVDLETIVLKAIAKEPAARYHLAEDMAEDLRRFLADQPILARRSTPLERFGRWCRRNPTVAALAAAVAALLLVAVVILTLSNAKIRREAAAKAVALQDLGTALHEKDEALGNVWLYRGLYGMDGDQAESLRDFDKAIELAPNNADVRWLRGFALGGWGRWDEALADMTKAREQLRDSKLIAPAARDWFVTMALVAKGDRAAVQAACRDALARIPNESSFDERGTLLWMCTVTPDAIDDPSRLADMVDFLLPPNAEEPTSDQLLNAGAAFFRAGKLHQAHQRLEQAVRQIAEGKPTADPMSEIFAHQYLAMTRFRLGLVDQAKADLAEASRLSASIQPQCWVDTLQLQLLTDETKAAVGNSRDAQVERAAEQD